MALKWKSSIKADQNSTAFDSRQNSGTPSPWVSSHLAGVGDGESPPGAILGSFDTFASGTLVHVQWCVLSSPDPANNFRGTACSFDLAHGSRR
jgi:hypothetical protein